MSKWDKYTLPFGEHKGKTLDEIPLKYLDSLIGMEWLQGFTSKILEEYLNDPTIKAQLEKELEDE